MLTGTNAPKILMTLSAIISCRGQSIWRRHFCLKVFIFGMNSHTYSTPMDSHKDTYAFHLQNKIL